MSKTQNKININELLTRGVEKIIKREELEAKLQKGEKIRLYLGVDPSSSVIHLGHSIALRKMRDLRDLGHEVILLIGDFTGMIGDPTDRKAARKPLTREEVLKNAETYKQQVAKILDFKTKTNPIRLLSNSQWLDKLTFRDVIKLAQLLSVQRLLERDMFQERIKAGKEIFLSEFLYPLMQAYDSIAMDVDMEVGGSDQMFNMLVGRDLMQKVKGKNKVVMTFELLEGTDGRKMSKSFNNTIGLTEEPKEMFGKIMSLKDELIIRYFTLVTDVPIAEVRQMEKDLKADKVNPKDLKVRLGKELVTMYHNAQTADQMASEFEQVFSKKQLPKDLPSKKLTKKKYLLPELLTELKLVSSKSEARRLTEQGGVKIDNQKITDWKQEVTLKDGQVIQVGKRKFIKISL